MTYSYTDFPDGYNKMHKDFQAKYLLSQISVNQTIKGSDKIVIYGAGIGGLEALRELRSFGVEPACFYDSDENLSGESLCNISILGKESLDELSRSTQILITPHFHSFQIEAELIDMGFNNILIYSGVYSNHIALKFFNQNKEYKQLIAEKHKQKIDYVFSNLADDYSKNVFNAYMKLWLNGSYRESMDLCTSEGYYPNGIINLSNEEVFVDCGAYLGDSICEFVRKTNGNYRKIYAFEPDNISYEIAKKSITYGKVQNIEVTNIGIYSEKKILQFTTDDKYGNRIVDKGGQKVPVDSIDNLLYDRHHPITYIKMDIEGAEFAALNGAKNVILEDAPKLAISAYHRFSDIWEIPNYILSNFCGYKIFIRNGGIFSDYICYAVKV